MPIPNQLQCRLSLPAIAAPMFRASGPDLVVQACKHGVIAAFPSLNQRTCEGFDQWLVEIKERLRAFELQTRKQAAPFAVNLIVNRSNPRFADDLEICMQHQVPLVITSLGAVPDLVERVHQYGGIVFHDVTSVRHAKKAAAADVDGLVLVCAGAGGHAGLLSPFAFVPEVRDFFDGAIVLAGCISSGGQILAAEALGADMAYLGTRFLATREALCTEANKRMVVNSSASDIVYTSAFSDVAANYLVPSIAASGLNFDDLANDSEPQTGDERKSKRNARKSIWSAGQGCGSVNDVVSTAELCMRLKREYERALNSFLSSPSNPCKRRTN